ncbi:CubicO group peptidase, beta-lactamase class C family [Devosia sp. YR412]|uniref:serine hydrolase domain-containing protein n=1 Tax=Devosia sp. YR412 TaxID=1881030 RepID=UPI0008AB119B|nr:serine hydrolase domain-containing protein [Devosia sp. YR412]SEQ48990.1 CubicO group peptidase, beta-lactamase class C family [Devosia sp. YR412]
MSTDTVPQIGGHADPRFDAVAKAFRENFTQRDELGGAVAIYYRNALVVDLWGGIADKQRGAPWRADTLTLMMSVAKGVSAICVAMLVDRGQLTLDAPVSTYWPEFAADGKGEITVRQALGHLAGIPVTDLAAPGDIYHWDRMIAAIANQKPLWPVGEKQVYHSSTLGFIAGELVRRLTGKTIGTFLQDEICGPRGLDYFIGMNEAQQARCSTIVASANNVVNAAKREPKDSIAYRMWQAVPVEEDYNSALWRGEELPSVNGHGTARAVAGIYNAMIGPEPLVSAPTQAQFLTEQKARTTDSEGARLRMAVGFMLNSPPHRPMGPNLASFGHSGAGGSQAFADPVSQLSLCWTTNKMHDGNDIGPRAAAIIEAAYASISD